MTGDPNMKTLYEWASQYPSLDHLLGRMKLGELIEIVDKVERCLGREFDKDKNAFRHTHGRDPTLEEEPSILVPCQDYSHDRKEEFLNCIKKSVGEIPLLIDKEYHLNVVLRLWSACLATAKTLSLKTQSGLNTEETRKKTICELDDTAKKDTIYRKGEEIACIWQPNPKNVSFDGVSPNSYARKYEDAWSKRRDIRSVKGPYNDGIFSEVIGDSEESGLGDHILKGTFWFPPDKGRSFVGTISNEEELVLEVNSWEDSYYISQIIDDKDSILIHGETGGKIITAVTYLSRRKMNIVATPYSEIVALGIRWLFYNEHFPSLDIKFRGLILNFTDITSWITPHDIIFPEKGNNREVWQVDVNDNCLIKFMYEGPISKSDDVIIRVESPKGDCSFEELLQEKNTIQDFLNFVITKDRVLTKSIKGIIGNPDNEKLIEVKYKTSILGPVDKSRVLGPSLFHCRQFGEDKLADIIRKWFELKLQYRIVYNFFVESLYKSDAVEMSYFKCVAFLEGYHRHLIKAKGKSRLTLAHRLREIWEPHKELIALNIPVTPFFSPRDVRKLIMRTTSDTEANRKMFWLFSMKFDADAEKNNNERKKRYKEILKFFQSEQINLTVGMLNFVENLLTNHFPRKFADYRNSVAHVLNDVYERNEVKWYYAFKIMQLAGLLCMLKHIGFEKKEIDEMFHLNQINDESRLKIIIEKFVGIY